MMIHHLTCCMQQMHSVVKMKKKTMIYSLLAVFILAASFSGCLGNGNSNNYERDRADIRSVALTTNGTDVIASVVTELDFNEKLDTANITVNKTGTTVHVSIYSLEPVNDTGSNTVDVKIGKVSDFTDGTDYTLIINNENDRDERVIFRFENNSLVTLKKAFVSNVTFEADGNEIYAVAQITRAGAGDTVDEQNITKTQFDNENEMDVYVPMKVISNSTSGNETLTARISVGQLNQLNDGRYAVEVNDREAYFTIRNGSLVV